jgi:hypothetical protein
MSARVSEVAHAVLNTLQRHAWNWRDYSEQEIMHGVAASLASVFLTSECNGDADLEVLFGLMRDRVELLRMKGPAH